MIKKQDWRNNILKVFKMKNDENRLYFANYDRIDEKIIFDNALKSLKKDNSFIEGKTIIGPSEDIKDCSLNGYNFSLVYDIDYGTHIHSNDKVAIDNLQKYFNS